MSIDRSTPSNYFSGSVVECKADHQCQSHIEKTRKELKGYENDICSILVVVHEQLGNHDPASEGHCHRMQTSVSDFYYFLDSEINKSFSLHDFKTGALLHDIGKICVDSAILNKIGKLEQSEVDTIKNHPFYSNEIVKNLDFSQTVVDMVTYHHERWDGKGYPYGLKGEEIPFSARMLSLIDVWDALTTDRPYRQAMSYSDAMDLMNSETFDGYFDPDLLDAFCQFKSQVRSQPDNGLNPQLAGA